MTNVLELGNMDAKRDWGHAADYVRAMWLMLQQEQPDDYVIASHETHTVREFAELAFAAVGIDIEWRGIGVDEIGIDKATGNTVVRVNPVFYRPAEVDLLLGKPEKAERELKWVREVSFAELVRRMAENDRALAQKELERG